MKTWLRAGLGATPPAKRVADHRSPTGSPQYRPGSDPDWPYESYCASSTSTRWRCCAPLVTVLSRTDMTPLASRYCAAGPGGSNVRFVSAVPRARWSRTTHVAEVTLKISTVRVHAGDT